MSYSVGFALPETSSPSWRRSRAAWQPAYDADREPRDGAWVLEVTGLLDAHRVAEGMRVIVRKERPHPGAQLRFTDSDGNRLTAFATNTTPGGPGRQLADLELRHRRRARCEDRIRDTKDTGLSNLPLHELDQNRIWCALVMLACELTAWAQMLALTGTRPGGGNPNACGCGCSPSPPGSPITPGAPCCTYPRTPPGPNSCTRRSPPCEPTPPPAEPSTTRPNNSADRIVEPAPTRATSAETSYPPDRITPQRPAPAGPDHRRTRAKDPG